jgi:hypothetical protein
VPLDQIDIVVSSIETKSARITYGYQAGWGLPPAHEIDQLRKAA